MFKKYLETTLFHHFWHVTGSKLRD